MEQMSVIRILRMFISDILSASVLLWDTYGQTHAREFLFLFLMKKEMLF